MQGVERGRCCFFGCVRVSWVCVSACVCVCACISLGRREVGVRGDAQPEHRCCAGKRRRAVGQRALIMLGVCVGVWVLCACMARVVDKSVLGGRRRHAHGVAAPSHRQGREKHKSCQGGVTMMGAL